MTHLPNAPLIYTLGLVRFPPVPGIERFAPLFHDTVRSKMPLRDELTLRQFIVEAGPQGTKLDQKDIRLWQFAAPDRSLALVFSQDSLVLHTNSYKDHTSFIAVFMDALLKLVGITDIGIDWVTGVAVRYVDLVGVKEGAPLDQLLVQSVLPPPFAEVEDMSIVEGAYVGQYRTPKANVRFQVLRNPQSTMPADLDTPLIAINGWSILKPPVDFVVVDTDCSAPIENAIPLDGDKIKEHMYNARCAAKAIFHHIGTDYASRYWKGLTS